MSGLREGRLRTALRAALFITLGALAFAPTSAQASSLPRTYNAQVIDPPAPENTGAFGWGITSADLTRDNKPELLVAQSQNGRGQIFIFDGATGQHIDTIVPPEKNPPTTVGGPDPNNETLGFVYVETMPDVGSCPGGDGADADKICDAATVGTPDGVPEVIVGARNLKVNTTDGSLPPVNADPNVGRGYIFDGATRVVLKRYDMPQAERAKQVGLGTTGAQFARVMSSLQAMPPCAGLASENNNVGVGPCPATPLGVRIGDVSGDNQPDLVFTARGYREAAGPRPPAGTGTAPAGSQCTLAAAGTTCAAGKAWVYSAAIAGTDPRVINQTALFEIQNPQAQTTGAEFGGNVLRVGDVAGGPAGADAPDGRPEFVIPNRNADYPFAAPTNEFDAVGAAFLFNAAPNASGNLAVLSTITSPEPQLRSQFAGAFNHGRAIGDVGASTSPDIVLPAALQNALSTDDGKIWAFNAIGGGGGATGSFQFATLTDPTPQIGGNFGGSYTGIGDVDDDPENPGNEILAGGFAFDTFTEASANNIGDLHVMNVTTQRSIMRIPHPTGTRGDGFGVGLTPMGDLNGDGKLDLASSSYFSNVGAFGGAGRAYILRSDDSPLPVAPPPPPPPPPPPAAVAPPPPAAPEAPKTLLAGRCVNEMLGTAAGDRLKGTIAGDRAFGLAGNDSISGYQGQDCIEAGEGDDRAYGDDGNDKLVGDSGNDRLWGDDDRDEVFGGPGNDRVYGGYGRDRLAGGPGNDRIEAGADADRIFGEGGKDRIIAGQGRNRVDGGSGNDSIDVRNGEVDTVLCGRGRDKVYADRSDLLSSCETIALKSSRKSKASSRRAAG